ncbi:DNA excision repair protein ERCC-5 isoform X2 [Anabrus simplex]
MREKLLQNLIKHNAVKDVRGTQAWQSEVSMPRVRTEDDMFQLPPPSQADEQSDSGSESAEESIPHKYNDLHTLDVNSAHFRSLPADMRHDILVELKETRKQSSWGRLHEIPKESNDFSSYQMKRLLKRRSVQVSLEEAEKEMGGKTLNLGELEELMADHGIITDSEIGKRIASDSTTRFIFINGSKVETSTIKDTKPEETGNSTDTPADGKTTENEFNKLLSPATDKVEGVFNYEDYDLDDDDEIDDTEWNFKFSEEEEDINEDLPGNLKVAKNFMFENSGLTQSQILAIIKTQNRAKKSGRKNPPPIDAPSTSKMICEENTYGDVPLKQGAVIADTKTNVLNTHAVISFGDKIKEGSDKSCVDRTVVEEKSGVSVISDSDSDAGFVEVEEAPVYGLDWSESERETSEHMKNMETRNQCSNRVVKNDSQGTSLEVVIQPNKLELDNDIFADIFSKDSCENQTGAVSLKPRIENHVDKDSSIEVVIQPGNCEIEDDIFSDIFSNNSDEICVRKDSSKIGDLKTLGNEKNASIIQKEKERVQIGGTSISNSISNETNEHNPSPFLVDFKNNIESNEHNLNGKLATEATRIVSETETSTRNLQISRESEDSELKSVPSISPSEVQFNPQRVSVHMENQEKKPDQCNSADNVKSGSFVGSVSTVVLQHRTHLEDIEVESESDGDDNNELPKPVLDAATSERLQNLQHSLEDEHYRLMVERGKQDRLAANITDQMYSEAQELLRLFGVPYIVAPMEAEAQCAFLDAVQLTDGTITDDSDIWLFGGQQVYRNFFNQKKHVMKFKAVDIQHYFKLSRQQMILLALLVGSDYTVGLQGIGPVTALEILAAFPPGNSQQQQDEKEQLISCLQNFRIWWASGKSAGPAKVSLRKKIKDIRIHAGFPSGAVIEAYLHPKVDDSKEKFSWSNPDLTALRKYAMEKFGWAQSKTDSILLPVMKKLNEKNSQQTLDSFIRSKPKLPLPEGRVSKRVQNAIHHMDRESNSNSDSDTPEPKIKKVSRGGRGRVEVREPSRGNGVRTAMVEMSRRGRGRGRGVVRETSRRGPGRGRNVIGLARSGLNYEPPEEITPQTEFILQREKDKLNTLKNKLKAIEVFRKSKYGLDKTRRDKIVRKELAAPDLSESSDSD